MSVVLLCLAVVLGSSQMKPVQWREWTNQQEKEAPGCVSQIFVVNRQSNQYSRTQTWILRYTREEEGVSGKEGRKDRHVIPYFIQKVAIVAFQSVDFISSDYTTVIISTPLRMCPSPSQFLRSVSRQGTVLHTP